MLGVAPSILTAPAAAVQAVSSMYYYTVLEWWEYGLSGEDMTRDGEFKISYLIWIVIIEGILFDFEVPTFWLTLL